MSTFPLKIVTTGGLLFDGQAERLIVRTTEGDMAVLARHINCVAVLDTGQATVVDSNGKRRVAACNGGILSVMNGNVNLISSHFMWTEASNR